ncbi:hypothetical protein IFR04_005279 [Cadophora malorum]|uniref:Major facilitator superfamily (MFS) profile domain-containing protein n=1 Tax=Cadophora malorum TaxID=108018 RepID=A0A8H7TL37_9HELO|nr:hypothetical protein IFR04_005279 [Cadophora malorum]
MALSAIECSLATEAGSSTITAKGPGAIEKHTASGSGDLNEDGQALSDVEDTAVVDKGSVDPVYEAKARVLDHAIQEIGMGWYQWQLFIVVGFGWANDNLWPIVTSLILVNHILLWLKTHHPHHDDLGLHRPRLPALQRLPTYLRTIKGAEFDDGSTYITYRNSLIIAAVGFPGALLGGALVEIPKFGRKGALAVFTILTGVFLYGTTTALTSNSLLGWNCGFNFASNIMNSVLYGYSPEIFPTKDKGTGNALTATVNRIFGIMAPIIAMFANLETSAPVYISSALFLVAGVLVIALPFESQGKASL